MTTRTDDRPRLRHRLTLYAEGQTVNAMGERLSGFTEGQTVWADVQPLSASEDYRAKRLGQNTSHKVVIRYRTGVATNDRLKFGTRWLVVQSVKDPDERREWLEIMAEDREEAAP